MKKELLTACVAVSFFVNAFAFRIETPFGDVKGHIPGEPKIPPPKELLNRVKSDPTKLLINPTGYINTTGIPTQGDFMEFVIKEPDKAVQLIANPGQWPYVPVANAMISGRNAVVAGGGERMPSHIRAQLLRWYPADLLDSVRWTSNWGLVQSTLQAAQMRFNDSTNAITLMNAVVFRNPGAANDPALWAHEVFHVQQYRQWGVFGFAKRWVDNSSVGGPVEAPAYARENEARNFFQANAQGGGGSPPQFIPAQFPQPQFAAPLPPPPPPPGGALPSGFALNNCGCWGFFQPNVGFPAPMCMSRFQAPRVCPGMCAPGMGIPWQPTCL